MASRKKNILLVDDHKTVEMIVRELLDVQVYNISYASSAQKGLTALRTRTDIDLLLLDLNLPDMSGYKILENIAKMEIKTPVIILSQMDSAMAASTAMKAGAIDYITKPIEPSELRQKIERALAKTK